MKIYYLPPGRYARLATVEKAIRDELYHLPAGDQLTTTELGNRILPPDADQEIKRNIFDLMSTIGKNCPLLSTTHQVEGTGYNAGRMVNARRWHHIDSPDMPPEPPAGIPSTGAASSVRRIDPALDALERRVERIERFLVLEPIGEGK